MTRVLMATHPWGVLQDTAGNARSGRTASFTNPDLSAATHWSAATGGTSSTAAVTADSRGRLMRWIEPGIYNQTVDGETLEVHATPGSVDIRVGELGLNIRNAPYNAACDYVSAASPGTNDRAAVVAATAALVAAGGGKLIIPGPTNVDTTAGNVIDVPAGIPITVEGVGGPPVANLLPNVKQSILRGTGTSTNRIIRFHGDVNSGDPALRALGGVKNLRIDGGGGAGVIGLETVASQNFKQDHVIAYRCPGGGFIHEQMFNGWIFGGTAFLCGTTAGLTPAIDFKQGATTSPTDVLSSGNTIHVFGLESEANYGPNLKLSGDVTNNAMQIAAFFIGLKMENNIADVPMLVLTYPWMVKFVGGMIFRTVGGSTGLTPLVQATDTGTGAKIGNADFIGMDFGSRYTTDYLIDASFPSLSMNLTDCGFDAPSLSIAAVRVGVNVPYDRVNVTAPKQIGQGIPVTKPFVKDDRATPAKESRLVLPFEHMAPTSGEETIDRRGLIATALVSGTMRWAYFRSRSAEAITILSTTLGTAAGATPTLIRYGIYAVDPSDWSLSSPATATATTTNGSPNLTSVTNTANWSNGQIVTGTNIPAGTWIVSGAGTATMVMSANATPGSGAVTITGGGLLAATPNDTTLMNTPSVEANKTLTLPLPKEAGKWYAFAVLVVSAAAMPQIHVNTTTLASLSTGDSRRPRLSSALAGQTDLPASVAAGSLGATAVIPYGVLRP